MDTLQAVISRWYVSDTPSFSLLGLTPAHLPLADLNTTALRTVLNGNTSWLDILIIVPGLHRQQTATQLNLGEYPAVGALTSGYVFRVENPATVVFLQRIGRTGHLTTITVSPPTTRQSAIGHLANTPTTTLSSLLLPILTLTTLSLLLLLIHDLPALAILTTLILSRSLNTLVIRRRCTGGWHGQPEPGVQGDLLVLLSQDRWVRIRGAVDDLKAVTSGQWLRDATFFEESLTGVATVLAYLNVGLAGGVTPLGAVLLVALLLVSAGLLALANEFTTELNMFGRRVRVVGPPKLYERRLDLVADLLRELGPEGGEMARVAMRRMGMTVPEKNGDGGGKLESEGAGEEVEDGVTM